MLSEIVYDAEREIVVMIVVRVIIILPERWVVWVSSFRHLDGWEALYLSLEDQVIY